MELELFGGGGMGRKFGIEFPMKGSQRDPWSG